MKSDKFIDRDLQKILKKKVKLSKTRPLVVGCGITSSHLGDERNLREFLFANAVVKYLRSRGVNTLFLLFDDSYDPLNFRQLRVAVNKDEKLIKEFERYCGTPIKLIPDPYRCHNNYSAHYQETILSRFHSLNIFPNIIDSWSSYESGLYDFAKEIVFTRMDEFRRFLKKKFPKYTMKKIFWPMCLHCHKMDEAIIDEIIGRKVTYSCSRCKKRYTISLKKIKGKFSWKIDIAIKWNIFKCDFEPFSKAYLDPDAGSYFIAKSLSREFFGGNFPEIIQYGQVFMDRDLSYKLLPSLPRDIFNSLFLNHRKSDMHLTRQKIIHEAKEYLVRNNMPFYDYVQIRLPYENLEYLSNEISLYELDETMKYGNEFIKHILKKEIYPKLPTKESLSKLDKQSLVQIQKLLDWVIHYKSSNPGSVFETFVKHFEDFLTAHHIRKIQLFPIMRRLLSQEHGASMSRILYYMTNQFLYSSMFLVEKNIEEQAKKN